VHDPGKARSSDAVFRSLRAQTLHYFARPHERMLLEPLDGAVAWRGEQLRQSGNWQLWLSGAEVDELKAAVNVAQATGRAMKALTRRDFPLPTLAARIEDWRREIRSGRGFVLIRGVPVGDWSDHESEILFWCLGQHLGIPGAQNPQGDLLGHVCDQRGTEDVRYYRTNKELAVHCDAADIVGLLCQQAAKHGGVSRIVSSVAVYNELLRRKPQLVPRLYQPLYFDTHGEGGVKAFPIAPRRSPTKNANYSTATMRSPTRPSSIWTWISSRAMCNCCPTTPSCTPAPDSRTGRNRNAGATFCACGFRCPRDTRGGRDGSPLRRGPVFC
jgi:hypothetical protein